MRLKTQGLGNGFMILYHFEKSRSTDQKIQRYNRVYSYTFKYIRVVI